MDHVDGGGDGGPAAGGVGREAWVQEEVLHVDDDECGPARLDGRVFAAAGHGDRFGRGGGEAVGPGEVEDGVVVGDGPVVVVVAEHRGVLAVRSDDRGDGVRGVDELACR